MEHNNDTSADQDQTYSKSRHIDETHIFNSSSGLYEPKSYYRQRQVESETPGKFVDRPLFIRTHRDWLIILISIFGLLISLLTLYLLFRTVHWARKQWEAVDKQFPEIQESADAAKNAADSAVNSLQFSKASFRQDQRPYVALPFPGEHVSAGKIGMHEGRLRATLLIQNFGKSPAIDAIYFARIAVGKDQIKNIKFAEPATQEIGIIPPGLQPPIVVYSDRFTSLVPMNEPMVIYGHIDYTDIFAAPKPQYSLVFCETFHSGDELEDDKACKKKNYIK